jgi:hypothetical protein
MLGGDLSFYDIANVPCSNKKSVALHKEFLRMEILVLYVLDCDKSVMLLTSSRTILKAI